VGQVGVRRFIAIVALVAITLAACSVTSPAQTSATPVRTIAGSVQVLTPTPTAAGSQALEVFSGTAMIDIGDQFFLPSKIVVTVGTTVVWTNRGQAGHTATARDKAFGSSTLQFGDTFKFTLTKPGRYQFYCMTHPDMFGEVVVVQ
jgi:plastocyanin